mgnify:CR=1 FL=1
MQNMVDAVANVGIAVFGIASIFLVARKNKWGFVCGLLSEPFWFATAIINHQWGILLLDCAYTVCWAYGCYEWFSKKEVR